MSDLKNGYYTIRRSKKQLRELGVRFEGRPWVVNDAFAERRTDDGWLLRSHEIGVLVRDPGGNNEWVWAIKQ